jgi:hypothetical protein
MGLDGWGRSPSSINIDLLEWAVSSKDAGELVPLPKEFRQHIMHPFRNPETGGNLLVFSKHRIIPDL